MVQKLKHCDFVQRLRRAIMTWTRIENSNNSGLLNPPCQFNCDRRILERDLHFDSLVHCDALGLYPLYDLPDLYALP